TFDPSWCFSGSGFGVQTSVVNSDPSAGFFDLGWTIEAEAHSVVRGLLCNFGTDPGLAIGFLGAPMTPANDADNAVGPIRVVCDRWTGEPYTRNWRFLALLVRHFKVGDAIETDMPIPHPSSLR